MFNVRWTNEAVEAYGKLKRVAGERNKKRKELKVRKSSQSEGLFNQVAKTINFLKNNPRHPSLNTHAYTSIENPFDKNGKVFEAYAQNKTLGAYRIFGCYGPDKKDLTILAITLHP